ncbi:amidase family protein [Bacillus pacificus]|uniref:amidase family protein n=1 Tax=Bacillus pacificus TaxID=2026187 RepID=UPI0027EE55C3|nr:amidase family protein [Bacillus pacificus]MDQ7234499.1 amidase family protein [Bacillus pacificus]MDQ7239606.1 amidase family protein [Bacillus pacificus]
MKKWVKITLSIAGGIVLLACAGGYYVHKNYFPKEPERIVYDKERVLKPIHNQLKGINIENVKIKEKEVVNATVDELQKMIDDGKLSYEELTSIYLFRIQEHDQNGITLNAVTEINPNAMEEARKLDKERSFNKKSNLYGMPVIVKDNIQTEKVMPTSAGTYVLKDWIADEDATIVKKLKEEGAFVLGKANMSEWANYLSFTMPSGYSGKKGQNLNPYGPITFDTSGSSSGSATVVAAQQSVVGLRPSLGMVSRSGIIPLAETLDTAGPMARTVKDAATLFNIMVSYDEKDAMTEKMKDKERMDYTKDLSIDGLKGKKVGVLFSIDRQDDNRKEVAQKIRKDLQDAGAILTDDIQLNAEGVDNLQTLEYEFKHNVNDFLSKQKNVPVKSLEEIIAFNKKDSNRRIKYGQTLIEGSEKSAITKDEFEKVVQTSQENARKELDRYLLEKGLDALVMINNDEVLLSAVAGYPELAVPAGYDKNGEPIGVVFVGKQFGEKELFNIGYAYEQQSKNRKSPKL